MVLDSRSAALALLTLSSAASQQLNAAASHDPATVSASQQVLIEEARGVLSSAPEESALLDGAARLLDTLEALWWAPASYDDRRQEAARVWQTLGLSVSPLLLDRSKGPPDIIAAILGALQSGGEPVQAVLAVLNEAQADDGASIAEPTAAERERMSPEAKTVLDRMPTVRQGEQSASSSTPTSASSSESASSPPAPADEATPVINREDCPTFPGRNDLARLTAWLLKEADLPFAAVLTVEPYDRTEAVAVVVTPPADGPWPSATQWREAWDEIDEVLLAGGVQLLDVNHTPTRGDEEACWSVALRTVK